ncbi:MAG: tetratricopeptide repeat protein [Candidatus Eremiobacteraeota bacterium]|nr:tetratricopeptide repeat protein [Candidatus Eremiobacteraeota bacterium]
MLKARIFFILIILTIILFSPGFFNGCARKKKPPKKVIKTPETRYEGEEPLETSKPIRTVDDVRKGLEDGNINLEKAWNLIESELDKKPGDSILLCLKARILWSKGDLRESLKILNDVLSRDPDNETALYFKTYFLLENYRNEEALEPLNGLLEIDPDRSEYQLMKGRRLFQLRKYDEAEEVLSKLIEKYPDYVDGYVWLLDLYGEIRKLDEGMKLIEKGLKRKWEDPSKTKSYFLFRKGEFVEMQGGKREAVKIFKQALELNPNNVYARARLAMTMVDLSDFTGLRTEVEKAMKIRTPDTVYPMFAQAQLYINDGRFAEAKEILYRALEKFPFNISAYKYLGYFTFDLKEYREAQTAYAYAEARLPGNYDSLMGLALIDLVRRDFESAEKILSSIKPPEHRIGQHYYRIGDVYLDHLRDYQTAGKYYNRALEYMDQGEDPVFALVGLGKIELKKNNVQQAMEYFNRALEKSSGNITLYSEIIPALIESRKYEIVRKYMAGWEKAVSGLSPGDRSPFYFRFAYHYIVNGDIDKASKMLEKVKEEDPGNPMLYSHLGKIAMIRGEKDIAESYLRKATGQNPKELLSWLYLAILAEEKGDRKKARAYYDEASGYDEADEIFRTSGAMDYEKAWIYSVMRKKEPVIASLRKACKRDIFNACRAYADKAFDWMRDERFFKEELPEMIKQVKDKTPKPLVDKPGKWGRQRRPW